MKFYPLITQFKKIYILFFIIIVFIIIKNSIAEDQTSSLKKSGYYFAEPSTREIQDDDFINPGFLWVENGKKLWREKVLVMDKEFSCQGCHGNPESMKGVSLQYPKVINKKLLNLDQQINLCRTEKMSTNYFEPESKDLLGLSSLITVHSRGLKQNTIIHKKNERWFKLGEKLYFKKIGQMGLACNQCHDERVGLNLRAEKVSQGHINGFPAYLLRWSKVVSVNRRIQFCNEQARAEPYEIFSDEYNALQLYLSWRSNGLVIESPSVRK